MVTSEKIEAAVLEEERRLEGCDHILVFPPFG